MPRPSERCAARNGTYSCQFIHGTNTRHAGMHYAYYVSSGRAYIAEWVDHFSQVRHREAPPPVSVRNNRNTT